MERSGRRSLRRERWGPWRSRRSGGFRRCQLVPGRSWAQWHLPLGSLPERRRRGGGTLNCRPSATGGPEHCARGGCLRYRGTVLSDRGNTAIGNRRRCGTTQPAPTTPAVGLAAMLLTTTAQQNVAIGTTALSDLTSGPSNVAIGASAGWGAWRSAATTSGDSRLSSRRPAVSQHGGRLCVRLQRHLRWRQCADRVPGGLCPDHRVKASIASAQSAGANLTTGNDNIAIGHAGVGRRQQYIRVGRSGHA